METTINKPEPLYVSVIVPVYNTGEFLSQCVESIERQEYEQFEVILIDDGSTDNSSHLCDSLAAEYGNIRVIHKQNGGLSSARNAGICNASFDWVCFVDSDDVVSPYFLSALVAPAMSEDVEMVAMPSGTPFKGTKLPKSISIKQDQQYILLSPWAYTEKVLYQHVANGSPFRLVQKSVVADNLFPEGILYEDMATTYRYAHSCKHVALVSSSSLYGYRINPKGITRSNYSHKKSESAICVTRRLKADIDNWYPSLSAAASARCFSTLRTIYAQACDAHSSDAELLWGEIQKYALTVSKDQNARFRDRMTAKLAVFGRWQLTMFCSLCRGLGLIA